MTRAKNSASYPAEFFAFFEAASEREVKMHLPTAKEAMALRAKLYALRTALRKENHPTYRTASNVEVVIRDESVLIGRPVGAAYKSHFAQAGITADTVPESEPEEKELSPPEESDANKTDDALSKFYPGT